MSIDDFPCELQPVASVLSHCKEELTLVACRMTLWRFERFLPGSTLNCSYLLLCSFWFQSLGKSCKCAAMRLQRVQNKIWTQTFCFSKAEERYCDLKYSVMMFQCDVISFLKTFVCLTGHAGIWAYFPHRVKTGDWNGNTEYPKCTNYLLQDKEKIIPFPPSNFPGYVLYLCIVPLLC